MFEIVLEIALSIFICGLGAYYFFLSGPVEVRGVGEEGSSGNAARQGSGFSDASGGHTMYNIPSLQRARKHEGAMWCNVLGRWVALLVLGGSSIDKDVWTDRVAYLIDKGSKSLSEVVMQKAHKKEEMMGREARTLRVSPDVLRLVRIELGGGGPLSGTAATQQQQQQQSFVSSPISGSVSHVRSNSDSNRGGGVFPDVAEGGNVGAASPPIGIVLPRIGSGAIVSLEVPMSATSHDFFGKSGGVSAVMGTRSSLRCFVVPITYEDQRFALQFLCHIPLMFLLPAVLCIPADVLSLHCALSIRRVIFHGMLYASFCGNLVELSFASEPQFTALFDVAPVRFSHRQQQQQEPTSPASLRGVASSEMSTAPPPLASAIGGSLSNSVAHCSREKLQEIADLAVKRAIQSITYPCVLQGRIGLTGNSMRHGGTTSGDPLPHSCNDKLLTWKREKALLPLHC